MLSSLTRNELFWRVAQAVTEMAETGSRARSVLEAVISWGRGHTSAEPAAHEMTLFGVDA